MRMIVFMCAARAAGGGEKVVPKKVVVDLGRLVAGEETQLLEGNESRSFCCLNPCLRNSSFLVEETAQTRKCRESNGDGKLLAHPRETGPGLRRVS